MKRFSFVLACVLPLLSSVASAGVADSPLPELLAGETTYHVYSVPGLKDSSCFGTYFTCTSMDAVAIQVGVELFFGLGGLPANDATVSSLSLAPGQTVRFGTSTALDFSIDSQLGFASSNGSARILSTSKKLVCDAFIADRCNSPVTFMNHLTIIAKTKQKAAN